jgi:hypothetical protein
MAELATWTGDPGNPAVNSEYPQSERQRSSPTKATNPTNPGRSGILNVPAPRKRIVARLDERDRRRLLEHRLAVGRLQRVLLDVLAGSKNRSFRNTWDYLDSTESNGNGTDGLPPGTNR